MIDGEVSRGEKMLYSGTDPESYITEYTLVYEDKQLSPTLHTLHAALHTEQIVRLVFELGDLH